LKWIRGVHNMKIVSRPDASAALNNALGIGDSCPGKNAACPTSWDSPLVGPVRLKGKRIQREPTGSFLDTQKCAGG